MKQLRIWLAARLLVLLNDALDPNDVLDVQRGVQVNTARDVHPAASSMNVRAAWRVLRGDLGFVVLLGGIILALAVSTPATFLVVQPFHSDDIAFAVLAVLLIGFAAIVCKLMTLILPEFNRPLNVLTIALLAVEWFSNYAHGLDLFSTAALGSTFGSIRAAGFGSVAALIYASIPPLFLFAFLHMAVARARRLLYDLTTIEMQQKLAPVREAMQLVTLMQQELVHLGLHQVQPPALSDASYPRPAETVQPYYAPPVQTAVHRCMRCGAPVNGPKQRAASSRWGCPACKAS